MKHSIFTAILLLYYITGYGQQSRHQHDKPVRNIIWFTPSRTRTINGLALGFTAQPKGGSQTINGANVEATILAPLLVVPAFIITVALPVHTHYHAKDEPDFTRNFFTNNDTVTETINGLNLSIGSCYRAARVNGVSISAIMHGHQELQGLAISGFANWVGTYRGVMIATCGNVAKTGCGVQIGLVNSCINCSGLQIGLLNQNGRRITPFIEYRSKRKAMKLAASLMTLKKDGS